MKDNIIEYLQDLLFIVLGIAIIMVVTSPIFIATYTESVLYLLLYLIAIPMWIGWMVCDYYYG